MLMETTRYPFALYAIESAPDDPGIYLLYEGRELTYIGAAPRDKSTIRAALLEHFHKRYGWCGCKPTHYSWELARDAYQRERELLHQHAERFELAPRCNRAVRARGP